MKRNRIVMGLVTAGLLLCSAMASATWQNGQGVVFFDSGDKEKIIFKDNANPDTGERTNATVYSDYINQKNNVDPTKPIRNLVPSGYRPAFDYKIADGKAMSISPVTANYIAWKAVGRSQNSLTCPPNTSCGEIAMVIGSDQCTSREISLSLGNDSVWKYSPLKYIENFFGISGAGIARGTSTCTNRSEAYTCYANNGKSLPYATSTFATIETRAKWGYAKMTPENGEIFPVRGATSNFYLLCRAAGGTHYENDFTEKCQNVKNKVYWEEFDLWPLANAPTTNACRTIKANQ